MSDVCYTSSDLKSGKENVCTEWGMRKVTQGTGSLLYWIQKEYNSTQDDWNSVGYLRTFPATMESLY